MAYIWEEYNIDKKFRIGKKICPYMEVFHNSSLSVEVNPFLRFTQLFYLLQDEALCGYIKNPEAVENIVFHYLAQLDKCKAMNYMQSVMENCREEIVNGYYGERAKTLWEDMESEDREIILYELTKRLLNDNETVFTDAIEKCFQLSSLCFEESTETYYLYIGAGKNEYNVKKYELLKLLFWNKSMRLESVWENHYGIVGIADTMHIGNIQII